MKKKFREVLSVIVGALYSPLYLAGFLVNRIARLILCISYVFLLDGRKAKDVLKGIFTFYY